MMGNAAIQAAERARDLLAEAVSKKLSVDKDRLVFADNRVFDTEQPDTGVTFAEAVCLAEAMFGTIGSTGIVHAASVRPARFKGGGVGPSPTYSYSAAIVEVEVDPSSGWIHVPARLDRARHRPFAESDAGTRAGRRQRLHGDRRSADGGEQTFRRLPPKLSHALVHKFPSMLEYKEPHDARTCRRW